MSHYRPIVRDEQIMATNMRPTAEQAARIEEYVAQYLAEFGHAPAGLHWVNSIREMVLLPPPAALGVPEGSVN